MTKKILVLFCCILISEIYAQSYWQWISSYPGDNIFTSGTITGRNAYFSGTYKALIKTTDGGETFFDMSGARIVVSTNENYAQTIAFADSMNGYMIEADKEYITRNGGIVWEPAYNFGNKSAIVCFSGSTGWKANHEHFCRTTNKGQSWTSIQNELNDYYTVPVKIFAVDQNRVYVVKRANNVKEGGIYQSNNGGLNFVKLNTGISADSLTQFSCYDIKIDSSGWGYAVGTVFDLKSSRYFGIILKTTDNGRRWSYILHPEVILYHVALMNKGTAIVSGNTIDDPSGIIFRTSDRGENWRISTDRRLLNHFPLYIPSADVLMFAGQRLYKSEDQGETFTQCNKYGGLAINDFVVDEYPRGDIELVVGTSDNEPRNLLISTDGGWNWKVRTLVQEMRFHNIAAVAENVIYLNDQYGTVYKSNDYGLTWSTVSRISSFHEAFSASAGGSLAAIGQFNTVTYYSSDGGNSWSISPIDSKYKFNSFKLIKPGIIMGCGQYSDSDTTAGFIYSSDNHGDWHIVHFPEEIYHADMVDDEVGYATSFRSIFKTTNSGGTWNLVLGSKMYYNYSAFIFSTGDYGFVKSKEIFLTTMNGGLTWFPSRFNVPFQGSIRKLAYNRNRDILALGDDGKFCIYKNPYANNETKYPADSSEALVHIESSVLLQNYPNPFNPETKISYSLKEAGRVNISIFNAIGEQVAVLLDEEIPAGIHELSFQAEHLNSGIYFYTLRTSTFIQTKKMILLR